MAVNGAIFFFLAKKSLPPHLCVCGGVGSFAPPTPCKNGEGARTPPPIPRLEWRMGLGVKCVGGGLSSRVCKGLLGWGLFLPSWRVWRE